MQMSRLFPRAAASGRDAGDDFWYGPVSKPVAAGVSVTVEKALTLPVVYDCLLTLSQTIGALPYAMFQRAADGSKDRFDRHPLMAVFAEPNPETDDVEFFSQAVFDLASEGNFFAEIREGQFGPISELWRLEPSRTTPERLSDGSRRYRVIGDDGKTRILDEADVWHIKVTPHIDGGLRGMSPIYAGRETIGAAIAVQEYAARFFENDCTPPFVIEHPKNFKNDEDRNTFLAALKRWWGGQRRHSPGVLEYGATLKRVGVDNDEAQFNATKAALDNSIARLWRMPPHKVGILDRATFSNIEQQSLEFVIDTLLPWLRLIEKSIRKNLIIATDKFFFEFNVAGLLRGDIAARYAAYAQGRQWGWLSVNEIRKLENMNPVAGGDTRLQPLNMVPIGSAPGEQQPAAMKPDHEILDHRGRAVSRVYGGNVVRMEDFRDVA